MGYYVEVIESCAYVPADKVEAACRGMEPMMSPEQIVQDGQGGSWSGGKQEKYCYSWVDDDKCRKLLAENDLAGFIEAWGFTPWTDEQGNIYLGGYDSKTGQEELMLQNLAPFMEPGTHMVWRGEEGELWASVFTDGKMHEKQVKIVW